MSWTDMISLQTIKQLRDDFKVKSFIETGTFRAINALVHSENFDYVWTCEINKESLKICDSKIVHKPNIYLFEGSSPNWLQDIRRKFQDREEVVMVYLDAHFYDANLPIEKRFVVLDELKALRQMNNCIIIIHDFWNGQFSGITYDGNKLDFDLVKHYLFEVNPNFKYYTNTECDIYNENTIKELINDKDADDNIKYANSSVEKRLRGILYAVPKDLDITKYKLRKII